VSAVAVLGKKLTHSTDVPAAGAGSAPGMEMEMGVAVASAWDVAVVAAVVPASEADAAVPA